MSIYEYRKRNVENGLTVRGLGPTDTSRCYLVLDDMAVVGDSHYPCIIYARENGEPIGKIGNDMRNKRKEWSLCHDCKKDPICAKNCLDVCRDYNNRKALLSEKT